MSIQDTEQVMEKLKVQEAWKIKAQRGKGALNARVNNKLLNAQLKEIWETNHFPFEFMHDFDSKETGTSVKIYTNIFNNYGWVKTPAVVADTLTLTLLRFFEQHITPGNRIVLGQTSESLVAPLMGEDILAGADDFITCYYVGNPQLNPPDIKAWLVVRVLNPHFARKEYIFSDKDSNQVMKGDQSLLSTMIG